jgi:NitT/TauT family transport system permease protein
MWAGMLGLLYAAVRLGRSMDVAFLPERASEQVSISPAHLPYYAARSLLRMFIALGASIVFALVYGVAAARSRRAGKVLVPLLDVLQSVPVLGFLSITVTGFLALFPGSSLGLEAASIFAIFTAQAWNLAFSFYHSLIVQSRDLDEASRMLRLTRWQRFWRLDVPSAMTGLVWNGMLSFGGGWFFLAASEAISVAGRKYALPGIGSYVAAAVEQGSLAAVAAAVAATVILVAGVNGLLWRPLVAWAERFRIDETEARERPPSAVLDVLRRSSVPRLLGRALSPMGRLLDRATRPFGLGEHPLRVDRRRRLAGDAVFWVVVTAAAVYGGARGLGYLQATVGMAEVAHAFALGALTFARVVVLVAASAVVWVPVGAWVGMNPRRSRHAQPLVQVLASFPANLLFPFVAVVFVRFGIGLNVEGVFLMALGAQWYVLFNAIAGASAIPADLREAMDNLGVRGVRRWRRLILPAMFPALVTGGITAAGGAWNASIVAEVLDFGHHHLIASGLGAYITEATARGDLPRVLTGVVVMSTYVVVVNRLLWRRLYHLAEARYSL